MIMAQSGLCGISVNNTFTRSGICPLKTRRTRVVPSHFVSHASATCSLLSFRKMYEGNEKPISQIRTYSSQEWEHSYVNVSAPFSAGEHGNLRTFLPVTSKRSRKFVSPRAEKDEKRTYEGFPPMQTKPKWWMRLMAVFPYMISFHVCWVFAETTYNMHPFLEDFEPLTFPFIINGLARLPGWFFTAYFFTAYLGVVRNNKFPHFLRFHVVNGMLLEITFSILGQVNDWLPKSFYWGKFGQFFWFFVTISFLFTVMLCISYALRGMYADVPFLSNAAYMQMPY
ncbi:protein TIC 20-I, chloroplastic isoform X1 [Cryptomeria japonica]|uniref:protein TIC 20-I, chloroplastic isoform X1 n=1 Tax=Cryptomeria japonica TaxID=3369 RepID=UPI0025ACEDFF|nr:protein TIC 20-I, chloroplastic isoform X1 [Cryptomeria japonica]